MRQVADEPYMLVRSSASNHRDGDEIRRHRHDWHQLVYASAGVLTVWTERGSWIVPPHWAVWVPAQVAHSIRFGGESALRNSLSAPGRGRRPSRRLHRRHHLASAARTDPARGGHRHARRSRDAVERALATLIVDEFRQSPAPPFALPQPTSDAIRRAVAMLADASAGAFTAGALARAVGLGRRTLERRFLRRPE